MSGSRSRKDFIERLAIYFLGVAMGLMILGFYWSNRQRAVQREQAQMEAAQQEAARQERAASEGTPGEMP